MCEVCEFNVAPKARKPCNRDSTDRQHSNNCLHYVCHQAIFTAGQHPHHVFIYGFPSLVSYPVSYFVATRRTERKPRVWYDLLWKKNLQASRRYFNICLSISTITAPNHHTRSRAQEFTVLLYDARHDRRKCVFGAPACFFNGNDIIQTTWVISWVRKGQTTDEQNSINEHLGLMSFDATHTFTHTHYSQGDHSHINRVKSQTEWKTRSSKSK